MANMRVSNEEYLTQNFVDRLKGDYFERINAIDLAFKDANKATLENDVAKEMRNRFKMAEVALVEMCRYTKLYCECQSAINNSGLTGQEKEMADSKAAQLKEFGQEMYHILKAIDREHGECTKELKEFLDFGKEFYENNNRSLETQNNVYKASKQDYGDSKNIIKKWRGEDKNVENKEPKLAESGFKIGKHKLLLDTCLIPSVTLAESQGNRHHAPGLKTMFEEERDKINTFCKNNNMRVDITKDGCALILGLKGHSDMRYFLDTDGAIRFSQMHLRTSTKYCVYDREKTVTANLKFAELKIPQKLNRDDDWKKEFSNALKYTLFGATAKTFETAGSIGDAVAFGATVTSAVASTGVLAPVSPYVGAAAGVGYAIIKTTEAEVEIKKGDETKKYSGPLSSLTEKIDNIKENVSDFVKEAIEDRIYSIGRDVNNDQLMDNAKKGSELAVKLAPAVGKAIEVAFSSSSIKDLTSNITDAVKEKVFEELSDPDIAKDFDKLELIDKRTEEMSKQFETIVRFVKTKDSSVLDKTYQSVLNSREETLRRMPELGGNTAQALSDRVAAMQEINEFER